MNIKPSHTHQETVIAAGRRYLCHFRQQRAGGYRVTSPQCLPLLAYGDTLEVARIEARRGIEAWIDYADARELA